MAVAFDATANGSGTFYGASSFTWNHTASGSDRALCVCVSIWQDVKSGSVTSVTYGGIPVTLQEEVDVVDNNMYTWIGYLINPSTGTNAVVVNMTGGVIQYIGGSVSMTGVDSGTPIEDSAQADGFGQTSLVTVTTAEVDCFVVGMMTKFNTEAATLDTGDARWNTTLGAMVGAGATRVAATAASYDIQYDWTTTDRDWTTAAIAFAPGSAPPPPASGDNGGFFAAAF